MRTYSKEERTLIAKRAWKTRRLNGNAHISGWAKKEFKFVNTEGINKNKTREEKARAYLHSGLSQGNLLFMPSQTCKDIEIINRVIPKNKFIFIGSESNSKAVKEIVRKVRKEDLNLCIYPKSIKSLVASSSVDSFSCIDFDFCETFSRHKGILQQALSKNIVKKGGIIAMTFSARDINIKKTAESILTRSQLKSAIDNKRMGISTIKRFVEQQGKGNYEFISDLRTYREGKHTSPMIFGIIKRMC